MHPHLAAAAARQGGVFSSSQAVESGYTSTEIRRRVRSGDWTRLRRGVLADTGLVRSADQRSSHLLGAAAALLAVGHDAWLSHRSAAVAHGLPMLGPPVVVPALTTERRHRGRVMGVDVHVAVTDEAYRTQVGVLPVTSVARTVSDLARCVLLPAAVMAADAALHRGLCTVTDVAAVVRDCRVWPGIARTKRVLELVDHRAESPGESLSRVAIAAAGLPAPATQVELVLGAARVRVDFMWAAQRLVGEFDGRVKYGAARDLWLEKQREDMIRRHGYRVVRWVWDEVHPSADVMVRRIAQALEDV